MLILLLVLGGLVGVMLGLIALSSMSQVSVAGLTTPHESRPKKERRPHVHADVSQREERYPRVPPPLAPMSVTPAIPQGWGDRVLAPAPSLYVTPEVPHATGSSSSVPSAPPAQLPRVAAAPPPPGAPSFTAFEAPKIAAVKPPPIPKAPRPPKQEPAKVVVDAAAAIAGDAELLALLEAGHFIAALKRYRDTHGVGLDEAKAALDAWRAKSRRHQQVAEVVSNVASTAATDPQIVAAIRKGNIIEAIKLYRAKTGVSLQDAKQAIDTWRRNIGR
jgi:ribosomal protein L7/L12